ncbi:MAG: aminotransferase class I/II-fold pyridoxal phosphate-dependent enzyme [Candidatus Kapaibacterium sp.]
MPEVWLRKLERELDVLREKSRLRSLRTYPGIDFGSNDYLGFAEDEELKEQALEALQSSALSSSSSRLLPGHHTEHIAAEKYFANFVGAEAALFFNSGYDANMALLITLPTRHDLILYDERSHASIYDGVHASLAKSRRFAHNSASDLQRALENREPSSGHIFVVLESVYSMDGDVAELVEIAKVTNEFGAIVIVDEAHAMGVLGLHGEGLVKETIGRNRSILTVHTCGKALGAAGAFVTGSRTVVEYLVNKARPFIYTTALPPLIPLQLINAIRRLESEGPVLVQKLRERSDFVRATLRASLVRWKVTEGVTPIISIIIGGDDDALRASQSLSELGFNVPAIRPPTVPEGSARLRLNISLRHSEEEVRAVAEALVKTESEMAR